jgi:hypothetical protein
MHSLVRKSSIAGILIGASRRLPEELFESNLKPASKSDYGRNDENQFKDATDA